MTSQDEVSAIFALDPQSFNVPPTMTHLHSALQEALISPTPLDVLLPKTWHTVDTLVAFTTRMLTTLSPADENYNLLVVQIVTRELGYLGLEIICYRRLWANAALDWDVRERLLVKERERLHKITPRLAEGIRLLLVSARSYDLIAWN